MSRGINKVTLVGNLGGEVDLRQTGTGNAVANLRVATSDSWKDKTTGERVERTEWHNVVVFGQRAEFAAEYMTTGSRVYVEGSIRTEKYVDRDGIERYATKVYADKELLLLSGGREHDAVPQRERAPQRERVPQRAANGHGGRSYRDDRRDPIPQRTESRPADRNRYRTTPEPMEAEDDIPF